jgi:ankyrin repeat protein
MSSSTSSDYVLHQLCSNVSTSYHDIYKYIEAYPRSRRRIDLNNWLPIHHAISLGQNASFEIIEYLLEVFEEGATKVVEFGRTCLHLAVLYQCKPYIIAMLLNVYPEGALIKTKILEQTPLHYSVRYKNTIDIVRILTDANRELLKSEDGTGRLPLHIALRNRCSQSVINWIIKKDPTATMHSDKCGYHPAAIAVLASNRLPALRLVLDTWEGALLEVTRDGDSLLHTACRASSPIILKYLLHIGISVDVLNHKGMKPHECLPKRPRKGNVQRSILGVDRDTIMNCLVQITKARRSWNPITHHLFPPDFRIVSKMLAMYSLRMEKKLVIHYREDNPSYLRIPFQKILKYMHRTWFDNAEKTEKIRRLQPHLQLGTYGQIPIYEKTAKKGSAMEMFANRRRRNKLKYNIRTLAKSMNIDIIRIATKRVIVGLNNTNDQTNHVIAKLDAVRNEAQSKINRAKKNAKMRKEQAMLKKMAQFFRQKDDGSNFIHPLDKMNKEVELEEERRLQVENGLLPSDASVNGRPWYEFLGDGIGKRHQFLKIDRNIRLSLT